MNSVAIDPGTQKTGIAIWTVEDADARALKLPRHTQVVSSRAVRGTEGTVGFMNRGFDMMPMIDRMLVNARELYIEFPEYFDSLIGHAAAVEGSTMKLAWFVGVICSSARERGANVIPVKPTQWKGQMSKEKVIRKIEDLLPGIHRIKTPPTNDAWDAVGIGLFGQSKFDRALAYDLSQGRGR